MRSNNVQQFYDVLEHAFTGLGVIVPDSGLEMIAECIHKALSVDTRTFHTPQHVLGLLDPDQPIQSLAALFHDLVYYQVDLGFCAEAYEVFSPIVQPLEGGVFQIRQDKQANRSFRLVIDMFGLMPGQVLSPSQGLNEFISALVMCQKVGAYLPEKELLKVITYIEATIPFRGEDTDGGGPCETLATRLNSVCQRYDIPMIISEQTATIHGAAIFANKDVEGFAGYDPLVFLDSTWRLLPETNSALRSSELYAISEYRQALQKMYHSLVGLGIRTIFRHYRGVPPADVICTMQQAAAENIALVTQYLQVKLLSIALLEALAIATGGDAPVSLFMGHLADRGRGGSCMEDFLPEISPAPEADLSSQLYHLLASGRLNGSSFDLKHSPVALFLYKSLGLSGVQHDLQVAFEMFSGSLSPEQFLSRVDAGVVSAIARACSAMALSRSDQLNRFIT